MCVDAALAEWWIEIVEIKQSITIAFPRLITSCRLIMLSKLSENMWRKKKYICS